MFFRINSKNDVLPLTFDVFSDGTHNFKPRSGKTMSFFILYTLLIGYISSAQASLESANIFTMKQIYLWSPGPYQVSISLSKSNT